MFMVHFLISQAEGFPTDLLTKVSSLGGTAILAIIFYLMYTGKLVTRRELDKVQKEKDEWQQVALASLQNNKRVQATAERAVGAIEKAAGVHNTD